MGAKAMTVRPDKTGGRPPLPMPCRLLSFTVIACKGRLCPVRLFLVLDTMVMVQWFPERTHTRGRQHKRFRFPLEARLLLPFTLDPTRVC